jgi:hypothetical protein
MYQIHEATLKNILQRKFSSLVGCSLEEIDNLQQSYNINEQEILLFKKLLKKLSYEAMRDIENQILAFSTGVQIGVSLNKPTEK